MRLLHARHGHGAVSLIESGEATDEDAIRLGLEGNLCRCTGYHNIVKAVAAAAGSGARWPSSSETGTFVGSSVKRKEDESLLRGRRTFVDDLTLPGRWRWSSSAARTRTRASRAST